MARFLVVVFLPLLALSSVLRAQTTYHLHAEASSTPGLLQLKKTGPDQATVALQSANLQGAATGIYLIKEFDTQAGDPAVTGAILSGTQLHSLPGCGRRLLWALSTMLWIYTGTA